MGTLKMLKGTNAVAETPEDALKVLLQGGYRSIVMYSSNDRILSEKLEKVYEGIKEHNKKIPNVEDQLLPTEPYFWRDIDGCLGVICAEIDIDVASEQAECLHIFSKPKYDCLSNAHFRKPLSMKALTTLAMLGHMVSDKR